MHSAAIIGAECWPLLLEISFKSWMFPTVPALPRPQDGRQRRPSCWNSLFQLQALAALLLTVTHCGVPGKILRIKVWKWLFHTLEQHLDLTKELGRFMLVHIILTKRLHLSKFEMVPFMFFFLYGFVSKIVISLVIRDPHFTSSV